MKDGYTADEVFELAEDIEREGERFYLRAAERASDERTCALLLELARAEREHVGAMQGVREKVMDRHPESATTDEAVSLYLRAVARGAVYGMPRHVDEALDGCRSEKDIIALAINKELDAILYFNEMKDLIDTEDARLALDEIIRAERQHVLDLSLHSQEMATWANA